MSDAPADPSPRRPTISVATIGHHRHGKTTLTAAITRALADRPSASARAVSVVELDRRGGSRPLGVRDDQFIGERAFGPRTIGDEAPGETLTIRAGEARYATALRSFVHIDSPGRRPWLKNAARAQALADALIVVVSAADSVQPQTREHLILAQALGIEQVVVFLNKCDLVRDGEWLDLVEHDVRELLGAWRAMSQNDLKLLALTSGGGVWPRNRMAFTSCKTGWEISTGAACVCLLSFSPRALTTTGRCI